MVDMLEPRTGDRARPRVFIPARDQERLQGPLTLSHLDARVVVHQRFLAIGIDAHSSGITRTPASATELAGFAFMLSRTRRVSLSGRSSQSRAPSAPRTSRTVRQ